MIDIAKLRALLDERMGDGPYRAWEDRLVAAACEHLGPLLDVYEAACRWTDDHDVPDEELQAVVRRVRGS